MYFTLRNEDCSQAWIDPTQVEAIRHVKDFDGYAAYEITMRSGDTWGVKYHSNLAGLVSDVREAASKHTAALSLASKELTK